MTTTTTKQKAPTEIEASLTLTTNTTTTAASKYKPFAATVFMGSQALIDDLQASNFDGNRLVCIGASDNAKAYQWGRLHGKPVLVLADNTPSNAEVENLCVELVRCGVSSIEAGRLNGQFITSYSQGGN
jgi:hypothetical protein